jgi:hypothetical protein
MNSSLMYGHADMKRTRTKEAPEPMALIMGRAEEILRQPDFRKPHVDGRRVHEAAKAWALVDVSDPFAYARMALHLRQGYELVSDILEDANVKLRAAQRRLVT